MNKTKKMISALLAAVMIFALIPVSAFAENSTGKVTGSYVYIRSGPGTGYAVLGGCLKGSSVSILSEENGWYKINYNNIDGYMYGDYIEKSAPVSYGTVTGSYVNLRKGPSTSNAIVATVTAGTQLPVLEKLSGWCKVAYNESSAYISSDYFATSEDSSSGEGDSGDSSAAVTVSGTGTVKYDVVNLRSGPGTTYSIVAVLLIGRELKVTAEVNGWYRVDYEG
ncbi:MAG: SH3 domain-containing protein, partial [Oscillospiraceae bacterium]|nr:SH3 domain-containing protein [Oscillospiraceae bacterium]